jgi:hypothetical protein
MTEGITPYDVVARGKDIRPCSNAYLVSRSHNKSRWHVVPAFVVSVGEKSATVIPNLHLGMGETLNGLWMTHESSLDLFTFRYFADADCLRRNEAEEKAAAAKVEV